MSRVESPFHAIAAQALDDNAETDANGPSAAATTVGSSSDARGQELDTVKAASDSHTENGGDEAADKSGGAEEEIEEETPVRPERKASLGVSSEGGAELLDTVVKKSKKRTNVWTKTTSRKSAKKGNVKNNGGRPSDTKDDSVLLKPFHQEDDPSYPILLSKIYKAEKIELSVDRLTASGSKGYRMVRATRGVAEGAWYFEIFVERLGDTGHTRLGWSTRRGDLQAPVGYDAHSYSYRDIDGCKVHAALREDYGQAYHEKDVIGFYINLPREAGFTQKVEEEVYGYKGQPYVIVADEPVKPLPGSEILFFKNGVCQGVSFKDVNDGTYFPAASMYTLPSQDCCKVVFNFGPDFKYPVTDLGDRPSPAPMCQASGPGETRVEAAPTTQTEVVADPAKDSAGKQRMAPDSAKTLEVEQPRKATVEENVHKDVDKAPAVKKKDKMPKIPAGNNFPPPLSKKSKAGEPRLNPESKRDVNVKSFKKNTGGDGAASTGLPSHKGGKRDTVGTGLQNVKGIQKDVGLASLKGSKKNSTGTGLQSSKGIKKDTPGPGLPNLKGTGFPVFKGSKKETFKGNKKEIIGIGLPSVKLSKKEVPVTGLQSHQRNKSEPTGPGLQSSKGTKRDTSGLGLPIPKQKKKPSTGIGLALTPSKDLTGMRTPMKPSKKILPGTGSSVSKKDFARKGFMSRELGSSALSGQRSWGGRMPGTTMDVDVVVVESSTSFQDNVRSLGDL